MSLRAKIILGFIAVLVVWLFVLIFMSLGGGLSGSIVPRSAL